MEPLAASFVPCDPASFDVAGRFNCDATSLEETLRGCKVLRLDFEGGGGVHIAHRIVSSGVVQLVAVQGQAGQGRVLDYLPWLEERINGHAVRLVTQRRGLIRELGKQGYTPRGVIMQKEIYGRR